MSAKIDKETLFKWMKKGAVQLQKGIDIGVRKTQEAAEVVNEKIEANPKMKAARDMASEFIKAKAERLSDVRINGRRIGDIPYAAQRLTERQLFKLMMKMRELEPEMNWDQFMPNPEEMPIFAAFETLGLPYGTPFDEVKKTYRKLMREYHPDKHSGSPEAEKLATEKTQEITAAYELICQHYAK